MAGENADTLESLINLAENSDEAVKALFQKIGNYLGYGINNIINTFNPDQVIVGNRLALTKEWIEEPIRNNIKKHTLTHHQHEMILDFSRLGKYSTVLGVSAFVVENFIKEESKVL
jgi:predicted NBD/HSP70 family sugar kinase